MNNNYFKNARNESDAKDIYRRLSKELHPDKQNGSEEQFKEMASQYASYLKGEYKSITQEQIIIKTIEGIESPFFHAYVDMLKEMYPEVKLLKHADYLFGFAKVIKKYI